MSEHLATRGFWGFGGWSRLWASAYIFSLYFLALLTQTNARYRLQLLKKELSSENCTKISKPPPVQLCLRPCATKTAQFQELENIYPPTHTHTHCWVPWKAASFTKGFPGWEDIIPIPWPIPHTSLAHPGLPKGVDAMGLWELKPSQIWASVYG